MSKVTDELLDFIAEDVKRRHEVLRLLKRWELASPGMKPFFDEFRRVLNEGVV